MRKYYKDYKDYKKFNKLLKKSNKIGHEIKPDLSRFVLCSCGHRIDLTGTIKEINKQIKKHIKEQNV